MAFNKSDILPKKWSVYLFIFLWINGTWEGSADVKESGLGREGKLQPCDGFHCCHLLLEESDSWEGNSASNHCLKLVEWEERYLQIWICSSNTILTSPDSYFSPPPPSLFSYSAFLIIPFYFPNFSSPKKFMSISINFTQIFIYRQKPNMINENYIEPLLVMIIYIIEMSKKCEFNQDVPPFQEHYSFSSSKYNREKLGYL